MSQRQNLTPDVWSIIFSNLAPCFLFDIARVSKSFNHIASSDSVYFDKLRRYFPNEDLLAIPVPAAELYKGKCLFRSLYRQKFTTLKSSASRRLLSYIIEGDIEQIRKFPVDGDKLFDMLKEQDTDGNDMLYYANRSKNIPLLCELLRLYLRHEVNILTSWNPLTIWDNWIDWLFTKVFGLPRIPLNNHEMMNAFTLASAFNLDAIRLIMKLDRNFESQYDEALYQAVRFGHLETIDFLLDEAYSHFKGSDRKFWFYMHPLVTAAKYDQSQAVTRLLEFNKISSDLNAIQSALITAGECHSSSVYDLLLSAYLMHDENSNMNIYQFMTTFDFHQILERGYADLVEMVLRRAHDLNDVKYKDVIRRAAFRAIDAGQFEVVKLFLAHGYIPRSVDCYHAKSKPEIAELLREARHNYKQIHSTKHHM